MDNLDRCAREAKKAGMSYGHWMALQPRKEFVRKIPEDWIACERCGKRFKPTTNQRFCDITCRAEAYREKTRKDKLNEIESST